MQGSSPHSGLARSRAASRWQHFDAQRPFACPLSTCSSCQRVVKLTQDVSIDQEALQQFAASLDAPLVSACAHGLQLPIKFESKEAEVRAVSFTCKADKHALRTLGPVHWRVYAPLVCGCAFQSQVCV